MSGAVVIDGSALARTVRDRVRREVEALFAQHGVQPGLATVLVGDDSASAVYVRRKREACEEVGIASSHYAPPASISQEELAELLVSLNEDDEVHGVLLQLPLPGDLDEGQLVARIHPLKDVDGLHPLNAGLLAQGRLEEAVLPCTPSGVIELLETTGTVLRGARVVVVGRSLLVGRPLAAMLTARDATVTVCHSRTRDLAGVCREADVLIAAAGVPGLIGAEMVRQGATVIDVGMNRTDAGLAGDVDFDAVRSRARAISPVPGGVGPMTIAMLLQNTVAAARRQLQAREAAAARE